MDTTLDRTVRRPRVVIVGAGFAGLNAAKVLGRSPVDVVLVDRNNYHKFQPLLYQVATAGLEPDEIAHNVREIVRKYRNVAFRLGTVRHIDPEARRLQMRSGPPISYDYLILAAGAVTNYFGVAGADAYSLPLKSLPDAIDLRNHILRQFERFDRSPEALEEGALTFVIVGGGPTGVEMAGALVELFDVMRHDYRHLDTRQARVVLLEMQPHLLPPYEKRLRDYTRRVLEKRGVEVLTGAVVEKVAPGAVYLRDGRVLATQTLIWAAGVRGNPLGETLPASREGAGRLRVEPDLSLPGHPEVFVTGDMAGAHDAADRLYPQVAQVAIQQGRHAARQILRRLDGRPEEPFVYKDLGQLATIGRHAAVAEFPIGLRMKGYLAWLFWVLLHIAKLVGFRNRANVFVNWIYNYFAYDRSARLILDMVPIAEEIPHEVEYVNDRVKERMEDMVAG